MKACFPPFDPSHFPVAAPVAGDHLRPFYLFLKRVVLPRIGAILEVRSQRIAQDLDQAARMKAEADAAVAAYEQELAEARAKANAIGQAGARRRQGGGRGQAQAGRGRARRQACRGRGAHRQIKSAALAEVGTIAEDTAAAIVEQLIGGKVDKATVAAAVKAVQE